MTVLPSGDANGWYDEAAMLSAIVAAIVSLVTLARQAKHRRETARNAATLDAITDTLNHTDQEVSTRDGPQTLGQRVVQLQRTVDTGFSRNDETHDAIFDAVHQLGRRTDAIRADVDRAHRRIDRHHPEQEST